jgi:hypothetical protein
MNEIDITIYAIAGLSALIPLVLAGVIAWKCPGVIKDFLTWWVGVRWSLPGGDHHAE